MKERCRGRGNPARPGPLAMTEGTIQFFLYQNQVVVAIAAECTAREAAALRRRSLAHQVATALRAGSTQATHHDNYQLWWAFWQRCFAWLISATGKGHGRRRSAAAAECPGSLARRAPSRVGGSGPCQPTGVLENPMEKAEKFMPKIKIKTANSTGNPQPVHFTLQNLK